MARGVSKVILIGSLGKDPETRSFPSGGSVTNGTLAVSESWKDKDGQQQERTEWMNLVFHNRLGEIAAQYLRKGSKVYIEGSIRTRKWRDKATGADRYTTEIHVNEMQMLDGKPGGGSAPMSGRRRRRPDAASFSSACRARRGSGRRTGCGHGCTVRRRRHSVLNGINPAFPAGRATQVPVASSEGSSGTGGVIVVSGKTDGRFRIETIPSAERRFPGRIGPGIGLRRVKLACSLPARGPCRLCSRTG